MRLAAIGDVHGDAERLSAALDDLKRDDDRKIVLLGDYVNLGPDPASVLDLLCTQKRRFGDRLVLLEGNHDRAFLEFLEGDNISRLLAMGGATTVRSYIGRPRGEVSTVFRASVPNEHVELLRSLETTWADEEVITMHQWPAERLETDKRFVILGHYRQSSHAPHVDQDVAYIDTGCGSNPDGVLTCFHFPERDWHAY